MKDIRDYLGQLAGGTALSGPEAEHAFELLMSGQLAESQIGALLALIAGRPDGPSVDEIVGGAKVLRRNVTPIALPQPRTGGAVPILLDTVGTGGAPKLFNISTIAAIVAAAAEASQGHGELPRVLVAKHGSLSRTGRGAADTLAALGYNLTATPDTLTRSLSEIGLCFAFAITLHPAMRHAAPARKALGFTTIFNILGPLTNPAGARRQLIGVYSRLLAERAAEALARLGTERSMVFSTEDGLDELTTTGRNLVHYVEAGCVRTEPLDAVEYGLRRATLADLQVGSLDEAVSVFREVLDAKPGPRRDIVLLNAAAALALAGVVADVPTGLLSASHAIDSGAAKLRFQRLIEISNTR